MWEIFVEQIPRFFTFQNAWFLMLATWMTLAMTLVGCSIGFVCGFTLAFLRRFPRFILNWIDVLSFGVFTGFRRVLPASVWSGIGWVFELVFVRAVNVIITILAGLIRFVMVLYVEYFRRTPFLVLLFLVLFGMTKGLKIDASLFTVACVSISIISTAFISEIIRAGLDSVHHNQWDAADAMNFGTMQTLAYVIIPQAWKVILPPVFAYFVMFIKDTALASQLGVVEITLASKLFNNQGYLAIFSFGFALVLYFILSYPLTQLGWWVERKLLVRRRGGPVVQPILPVQIT